MVEHSTASRGIGGSILLVPCLKIVGSRVTQPVFFLENQTSKKEQLVIGEKNIIINSKGCAMNAILQIAIKLEANRQNILRNYHIWFGRLLLKALATAWATFMSLIIFLPRYSTTKESFYLINKATSIVLNKTFQKNKVLVFRERSSVVEHSTADREVGGSIPLAPYLRIAGRVKQPVLFLENQT